LISEEYFNPRLALTLGVSAILRVSVGLTGVD